LPSDTRNGVHVDIRKNEALRSFMSLAVFTQMYDNPHSQSSVFRKMPTM